MRRHGCWGEGWGWAIGVGVGTEGRGEEGVARRCGALVCLAVRCTKWYYYYTAQMGRA